MKRWGVMIGGAVAAAAALAALWLVLSQEQPRRSGTNSVFPSKTVAKVGPGHELCQLARVPKGTSAIETPLAGSAVSDTRLRLLDGTGREVNRSGPPRRRRGLTVRFDLSRRPAADLKGRVCLAQGPAGTTFAVGSPEKQGLELDGRATRGAVTLEYYRPGSERLVTMIPAIAQRIGRTRGRLGGAWRAVAVAVCFGAGLALAAWLLAGLARGRPPSRLGLLCATVAVLNALAWSLLTPVIQVPDENYHLSYVQDLAEHGSPPEGGPNRVSDELNVIVAGSASGDINFNPVGRPHWSEGQESELDRQLARDPNTDNTGASVNVKDYPPLYYGALAPVYHVSHAAGGSTLDAVTFMRAAGALGAGVTVFALFLFLLEMFPGRVALGAGVALVCAYQPVFSWISGGVNPDALLIPLGAVLFWLIARAFRRGLDVPTAVGIGLCVSLGMLTKISALGLAPGVALGTALLLWRRCPPGARLRAASAATISTALPLLLYAFVNTVLWGRSLLPGGVEAAASSPSGPQGEAASGFLTYLWQYVLPPVGSMTDFFKVPWTPKDLWTPLWVGKFGWYDYEFPDVVNDVAFVIYVLVAVAAIVALLRAWRQLWMPLAVFAALGLGLNLAIARAGYPLRASGNLIFEQGRYLMPLLALYALMLAFAASLVKSRRVLPVLALAVGVSALHLLGAFVLTIDRYYL